MRIDRSCDAFRKRLDRNDPDVSADPHVALCPSCAIETALALRLRERIAAGKGVASGRLPASFASRTAYVAAADRAEGRGDAWRRTLSAPAFTVTAVATALALSLQEAIPSLAGRLRFDLSGLVPAAPIHGDLFAIAVPILACVAVAALAGVRFVRRAI